MEFLLCFIHSIEVFCIPSDLYIGVMKSVVFGMIVALVGCDRGMTCEAGAEGVGGRQPSLLYIL
ncbi:MAG: ABC transporter permease [Dialister invisus]